MEPKTLLKKPIPILLFLIIFIASVSSPLFFVHAQIIDGTATVTGSNVTSASMTLTTTKTPDVLLLAVSYSKPFDAVSSISTSCSTSLSTAFTHEVTTSQGAVTVEVWYAVTNAALSSCSITVTMTGAEYFQASVFALVGPASTTSPFDGSPVSASGNSATASGSITTTAQNDVILGFVAATGSPSFNWLPYTSVITSSGSGNTSVSSGDRETTISSGTYSIATSLSSSGPWAMAIVAVQMLGASATESFNLPNPSIWLTPNSTNQETFNLPNPSVWLTPNSTNYESFNLPNPSITTSPNAQLSPSFTLPTPCMNISVGSTLMEDTCNQVTTLVTQALSSSLSIPLAYYFIGAKYGATITSTQKQFTVDLKSLFTVNSSVTWQANAVAGGAQYLWISPTGYQILTNISGLSSEADNSKSINFTLSGPASVSIWIPSSLNSAPYQVLDNGKSISFSYNGGSGFLSFTASSPISVLLLSQSSGSSSSSGGGSGGTTQATCTVNCSGTGTTTNPSSSSQSPYYTSQQIQQAVRAALQNPYFDLFLLFIILIIAYATIKKNDNPKRRWKRAMKGSKDLFG
jgi:hypothetical protein